jgi:glycosyltransferase involved in cell wall biosynthesis
MRLLFASPYRYLPDSISGREVSTHALALRLRDRGLEVAVFAAQPKDKDAAFARDEALGYPVYRAADTLAGYARALHDWRPEAAILPLGPNAMPLAALSLSCGTRTALRATNVDPANVAISLIMQPGMMLMANSPFTARRIAALHGIEPPVVASLVEPEHFRTTRRGDAVLMVNPTLMKGVEIFFRLAERRPKLRFVAIESWDVSDAWRLILANRARALGNIELWPAVRDMRDAYAEARLVLMPSIHEETYGRIVAEAQVSGIPAVAADRGALKETVGEGGVLVPLDAGIADWAAALDRVAAPEAHAGYAAAALAESERPERRPERVVESFLAALDQLLHTGS